MSAPRQIPDKRCAECPAMFRPHSWKQFHNPDSCCSFKCGRKRAYRKHNGEAMRAGSRRRWRDYHRVRVEQILRDKFGALTDREVELFNLGTKVGFDRGYGIAYSRLRRNPAA